jgi:hypothetical protein
MAKKARRTMRVTAKSRKEKPWGTWEDSGRGEGYRCSVASEDSAGILNTRAI